MMELPDLVIGFWPVVGAVGGALVSGLFASNAADDAGDIARENADKSINRATAAYTANDGTIRTAFDDAGRLLDEGARAGVGQIQPYADTGMQAFDIYSNATGVNGEGARGQYFDTLMDRPEIKAARDKALRAVQARYGTAGKLGSGSMYRAMQRTDLENASSYIDKDLERIKPVMQQGALANQQIASTKMNLGTALAGNSVALGNALVGNQDQYTSSVINANAGTAATTANAALASGAAWGNAFSNLGQALGNYAGYGSSNNSKIS